MAREALGLVLLGRDLLGGLVGVVAGGTTESAWAPSVAPAPEPAPTLRANPSWVLTVVSGVALVEDVAGVALLLGHRPRRGVGRVDDGQVGETGFDGRNVMAPWTVERSHPRARSARLGTDSIPPRRGNVTWHSRQFTTPPRVPMLWPAYSSIWFGRIRRGAIESSLSLPRVQ